MAQEIKFPVDWTFRLIAEATATDCPGQIAAILQSYRADTPVTKGDSSKSGRYLTYKFTVRLSSKPMMDNLATDLSQISGVKFVL